ncbi:phospholipase D family protein [Anaerospora hongkongensis]|uniref:phospholipase D family protein n=1 Tax=Anaerospora hongkongensis TaxID=244830 RepID=UPI0028A1EB58|nr:phospholipase D family protein [Anaerospora hongkongensis]
MYYWHGKKLKDELLSLKAVRRVQIATAYLSWDGLKVVQEIVNLNALPKSNIVVYLSPEFSYDNPGKLLAELTKIAEAYIVTSIRFHPKVYLFEADSNKLIFGSSNLTGGGIEGNIEFDSIGEVKGTEFEQVKLFFEFCDNNATKVCDDIMAAYANQSADFTKLRAIEEEIKQNLYKYIKKDDLFDEDTYDIEDYYFNFESYEVLFPRNESRTDSGIMKQRKILQDKLLTVHRIVYPHIKKMNLNCHWNPANITSLIRPCIYNKGRVGWIGVRYGKSRDEVMTLNVGAASHDEEYGFPKHACLQFCITSIGFEICLYHSVRHDAVDRGYVHDRLDNNTYQNSLAKAIEKLTGQGMVWKIWDSDICHSFEINEMKPEEFITYYKLYDREGRDSYLSYMIEPEDPRLKDTKVISKLIVEKINLMLPLYQVMAFRI